jgi:carbamoyl-phosphate synthase small subunit
VLWLWSKEISIFPVKTSPAVLALADGSVFWGQAVGCPGITTGEVVFNTAMSGYQEIMTDPSYAGQLITFTSPHIGNVGINQQDQESTTVWAQGCILREMPTSASNWRATHALADWLQQQNIVGIAGIDTRQLTHVLRNKGTLAGCIMSIDPDVEYAIALARTQSEKPGQNFLELVSTQTAYTWTEESIRFAASNICKATNKQRHIVVYDFGVKLSILRMLKDRACMVTVVPATTSLQELFALHPDGVVLSNGPGDPAVCDAIIEIIRQMIAHNIPILGICLGHQLLALACGAKTFKMKFGHHGANHPIVELATGRVHITSQNHNFAVDEATLPSELAITHRSLFDNTIQGFQHKNKLILSVQGHPEANPGPHDAAAIFDTFLDRISQATVQGEC